MSGGGSTQNMQTTLSNNRKLLKSRLPIFKREQEFADLKSSYTKIHKSIHDGPELSEEHRKYIRDKIKSDYRKRLVYQSSISLILFAGILWIAFSGISSFNAAQKKGNVKVQIKAAMEKDYRAAVLAGDQMMQKEQWYFAVGNYERALQYRPQDLSLKYKLALSYCQMCFSKNRACSDAREKLDGFIREYPNDQTFQKLRKSYLETGVEG